jgi:frataxin-like iron-binding protein CyaY
MNDLEKVKITEDATGKSYYFDSNTFFKIIYRPLGKDNFTLSSKTNSFFASNKKTSPIEVYTNEQCDSHVITINFDNSFPFIEKSNPNKTIWSTLKFDTANFGMTRNLLWLKEGEKIIELRRIKKPLFDEEIYFNADLKENNLELFASMLYMLFYFQPDTD